MPALSHIALTMRDRDEVANFIDEAFARGPAWMSFLQRLAGLAPSLGNTDSNEIELFCVQREPRLLSDHSIQENWKLPLWNRVGADEETLKWLLAQAGEVFSRYSSASVDDVPDRLDAVARVAAQFAQAHIMMPDILLLDAVLSGWHRADQAMIGEMVRDYANRYPLRPLVYVDVSEPPQGILLFRSMELVLS